jgi:hypothetical protein
MAMHRDVKPEKEAEMIESVKGFGRVGGELHNSD